ncbi:MAG: MurT ligase domain-containing protein [Dehalococcoidia bacterium]
MAGVGIRERGALLLGRGAGEAARRLGRGGGTALPGLVAGTLAPGLLEACARQLGRGVITVTGTNGKTTTSHLLAAAARIAGWDPLANRSGSNLERGVVSSFVAEAGTTGAIPRAGGRLGVVELDEAVWPRLLPRLRPRVAVFLNLFRDQLDRYGEVDSIAEGWRRALAAHASLDASLALVLNVDDPSVAALTEAHRGEVIGFGVEDPDVALAAAEHASDARFCGCGATYRYDAVYMGHVGAWRCPGCGRTRPRPLVAARHIRLDADTTRFELSVAGATAEVTLPLAGLYSVYNALAAAAGAHALGLPFDATVHALAESGPAFGRQERFNLDDRTVRLLLAKNPTGLNEVIRTLRALPGEVTLLALLNDGIQDGQDVSWIYDADFEQLTDRPLHLVVSGDRADDLALRCALAGLAPRTVDADLARALDAALAATPAGGRIEVVATYTAMLAIRALLAARTGARPYWDDADEAARS